jgi:FtsP/CotA-like multicopper oxidase with cupredoxin domain
VNPVTDPDPGKVSQKVSSLVTATAGQKVLLRLSNLSVTNFFTVTALGLPMKVVGAGAAILRGPDGKDLYYDTNSVTLGGGEAADVIIDTAGISPGTYFLYTANLNYLSNNTEDYGGMMTEIVIN